MSRKKHFVAGKLYRFGYYTAFVLAVDKQNLPVTAFITNKFYGPSPVVDVSWMANYNWTEITRSGSDRG